MALQIRKGTEAERTAGGGVVFATGELIYVTDTDALFIGDGSTAGGVFLTNNAVGTIGNFLVADTIADELKLQKNLNLNSNNIIGTGNINIDGNIVATGNIDIGDNTNDTVTITAQVDSNITPTADTTYDLGSQSLRWRNVFASGLTIDGSIDAVAITANTVADNSTVMVNVATNEFTGDLTGNVTGNLTGNVAGNVTGNITGDIKGSVFADDSALLVDAVEGVLRGNHVGTLTGDVLADNGVSVLDAGSDGTNANFVGTVQGNVTGNVTGNLAGNVTGNVTGDLIGDTTGYHTGDIKGSVFGDGSTVLVDAVAGAIPGENITGTVTASFVGNVTGNTNGTHEGNILTNFIDSADSSLITVTPETIFESDVNVQNTFIVGFDFDEGQTTIFKDSVTTRNLGIETIPLTVKSTFTNFERDVEVFGELSTRTGVVVSGSSGNIGFLAVQTFNGDITSQSDIDNDALYDLHASVSNTNAQFNVPVQFPVVADDTARGTLVPTPEKGMVILMESGTTPAATNQLQFYNGTNWVNV